MATTLHVLSPPDPIHIAIAAHTDAWARVQTLPASVAGRARLVAAAALDVLLDTPCETHAGATALLQHLRWFAAAEGFSPFSTEPTERAVLLRTADLRLFLGDDHEPAAAPPAMPLGVIAQRVARRLFLAGEMLAALVLIAGGAVVTGVATLL